MSMEAVRNLSIRTIRARLMTPPGGRVSSELEVISSPLVRELRMKEIEEEECRRGVLLEARRIRARELLGEFKEKLEWWLIEAGEAPLEPVIPRKTVAEIIGAASKHYDIPIIHILSARRKAEFVRPRRMVMYLAREHTEGSFPMIGVRLGGRDHTTIMAGYRAIAALVAENDPKTINDIAALRAMLNLGQE